jgi:hypothetical protein
MPENPSTQVRFKSTRPSQGAGLAVYHMVLTCVLQKTGQSDANTQSNPISDATKKVEQFAPHNAAPGPVIPQNMPEQEGTKEERQAKTKELNK